jgi:hypothetical protein
VKCFSCEFWLFSYKCSSAEEFGILTFYVRKANSRTAPLPYVLNCQGADLLTHDPEVQKFYKIKFSAH